MLEPIWKEVFPHIYQVKVPVPFSLKWVNSYLVIEEGKFAVIDPGLHNKESLACWQTALEYFELSWSDCHTVMLTHQHPDHYGLAGYVQQQSGCKVLMTEEAYHYTERLWGEDNALFEQHMLTLMQQHGAPVEIQRAVIDNLREFEQLVKPRPSVTLVQPQQSITLANRSWSFVETKGHAYGQVMLYNRETKTMICGDQVLPKITPHVGVIAGESRPVLYEFIINLQHIAHYEVELALPGHREPFSNFSERALQIVAHHERRLDKLVQYVKEQGSCVAFTCCEWLFGTHLRENAHNMRFALTETIAHLEELVRRKLVRTNEKDGIISFVSH